jgi:hypothetical protein
MDGVGDLQRRYYGLSARDILEPCRASGYARPMARRSTKVGKAARHRSFTGKTWSYEIAGF